MRKASEQPSFYESVVGQIMQGTDTGVAEKMRRVALAMDSIQVLKVQD